MSISVTCRACGKALKLKDEAAGRVAKCPDCGGRFTVPGGSSGFVQQSIAAAKKKREEEAGSFEIPWRLIFGGVVLLLIIAGVVAFLMGPKRVWAQWEEIADQANNDVIDVVTNGLRGHLIEIGAFNPEKAGARPGASDVMFFRPSFVMSMPDSVKVQGASTAGPFTGHYFPKTHEVDVEVEMLMFATGKGANRTVPKSRIHGKVDGANVSVEVDGKKVDPNAKPKFRLLLPADE
jgi:DNA-directed RNA polymerase subunit RPC12/RpoP